MKKSHEKTKCIGESASRDNLGLSIWGKIGFAPFLFFFSIILVQAAPIEPHLVWLIQPNNDRFMARILGDERKVYYETPDGYTLLQDPQSKYWTLARLNSSGELAPSKYRFSSKLQISALGLKKHLREKSASHVVGGFLESSNNYWGLRKSLWSTAQSDKSVFHLAVLLIDFPDVPHTFPKDDFEQLLFSKNFTYQSPVTGEPSYGSLYDYYFENSGGKLRVEGQVLDWVRADSNKSYYLTKGDLIAEALQKSGLDVNSYDGVAVIYSGNVGSVGSRLWPETKFAGLAKPTYVMSEQWLPKYHFSPIGIHCHEFGHLLGLPDLYDTDFSSGGIGVWGLMGYGEYGNGHLERPFQMCAWSKQELGWLSERRIYKNETTLSLLPIESATTAAKVISGVSYYLLENRQNIGYDLYLPFHGLLIWHIDERFGQQNHDLHRLVDLVEADGDEKQRPDADPFPGADNIHVFQSPQSNDYDSISYVEIRSIAEQDNTVHLTAYVHLGPLKLASVSSLGYSFPTLFEALEMSDIKDSISLKPAYYTDNHLIIRHPVSIVGENPDEVHIDGANGSEIFSIVQTDSVHLEGMTLTNAQKGVKIVRSNRVFIRKNIFHHLQNNAIEAFFSHLTVTNNTVVGNGGSGIYLSRSQATLLNNILAMNNFGVQSYESDPSLRFNDVWNNIIAYSGTDTGFADFQKDPEFVDAFYENYHLQPFSPCIDAGDPAPQFNDPDGTRNDLGALPFSQEAADTLVQQIAINCGGAYHVDTTGRVWVADRPFTGWMGYHGGEAFHLPDSLMTQLMADSIFFTSRIGMENYEFKVQNGYYRIQMKVIEPIFKEANRRVFTVLANEDTLISEIDPFAKEGFLSPFQVTGFVSVRNKRLEIHFIPIIGQAIVSGISFQRLQSGFRDFSAESRLSKMNNIAAVCWGDYNGDNAPDVFLPLRQKTNFLFRNNGKGLFVAANQEAGLTFRTGGRQAVFFDFNNDGFSDLFFVDSEGKVRAFQNAKGTFVDITSEIGLETVNSVTQIGPIDFDKDAFLDIVLSSPTHLWLFKNMLGKTFRDTTSILPNGGKNMEPSGIWVADFNGDGWDDIFVTNYDLFFPRPNRLLLNQKGNSFQVASDNFGFNGNDAGVLDFNHDGHTDIVVVSSQRGRSKIFQNMGCCWKDRTANMGIFPGQDGYQSILCGDWDNDGWEDMWVTTVAGENEILMNQAGNRFLEKTDSLGIPSTEGNGGCEGLSCADIDQNGTLDVAKLSSEGRLKAYCYVPGENHWIGFHLVGQLTNPMGLGTKLKISAGGLTQIKENVILSGNSFSGSTGILFGLGKAEKIDSLIVFWSDGRQEKYTEIMEIDRYYTLIENVPLAIGTVLIEAKYDSLQNCVRILWKKNPDINRFSRLSIERSGDKQIWQTLASVSPKSIQQTIWVDKDVDPFQKSLYYRLKILTINGQSWYSNIDRVKIHFPQKLKLIQNFPNPFNEETKITYFLLKSGKTYLEVFDCTGRRVQTLISAQQKAGFHSVIWRAKNVYGNPVSSGIYFFVLRQGRKRLNIKTLLLK